MNYCRAMQCRNGHKVPEIIQDSYMTHSVKQHENKVLGIVVRFIIRVAYRIAISIKYNPFGFRSICTVPGESQQWLQHYESSENKRLYFQLIIRSYQPAFNNIQHNSKSIEDHSSFTLIIQHHSTLLSTIRYHLNTIMHSAPYKLKSIGPKRMSAK